MSCLILMLASAHADQPVTMWEIHGTNNRVFLLGSVHLLRASDHPLSEAIESAYAESEMLVMELDIDDMNEFEMPALVQEFGMAPDGATLRSLLGDAAYSMAAGLAQKLDVPLAAMEKTRPWFAALTIEIMIMNRTGFDPDLGVERYLASKAETDGKEIRGFETLREQIEILSSLTATAQRDMLLQILTDGADLEAKLDELIAAWRVGDIDQLEDVLLKDMSDYPELYDAVVVSRNNNWARQIEGLLDDADDYLVVVGALHLIGPDGVPSLLERNGITSRQVGEVLP